MVINASDSQLNIFGNNNAIDLQRQTDKTGAVKAKGASATSIDGSALTQKLTGSEQADKKKEAAKKKALKVVQDAFEKDQAVRDNKDEIKAENASLLTEKKDTQDEIKHLEEMKDTMVQNGLSDEEKQELEDIIEDRQKKLNDKNTNTKQQIQENNASVRNIKQDMLKSQDMQKATDQADQINDAASKSFVGSLFKDAVDSMDEKREEEKKQAEEAKEKKDEEQAKIDAAKENAQQAKPESAEQSSGLDRNGNTTTQTGSPQASVTQENSSQTTQPAQQIVSTQDQVQQSLQKLRMEEKLLPEDLKGIVIDQLE